MSGIVQHFVLCYDAVSQMSLSHICGQYTPACAVHLRDGSDGLCFFKCNFRKVSPNRSYQGGKRTLTVHFNFTVTVGSENFAQSYYFNTGDLELRELLFIPSNLVLRLINA